MNVRPCEYMIAIAENGSLSKAARELGVSQPTLSSFLIGVEQQVGKALFVRHPKSVELTEAGRIYLDACQRIVDVQKRTYHSILGLSGLEQERFSVGVTPHRGSTMFARVYPPFYQRFPGVFIDLREGYVASLLNQMDRGELDMTIAAMSDDMLDRFDAIIITREELLLCVPDFHPLAARALPDGEGFASIDIRLFQDTPFVMWGEETMSSRTVWRLFREKSMTPTIVFESNNVLFIDSILASGAGVGFLPASFCKPGQRRVYFSMNPPLKNSVGLYHRKGTTLTEAQQYFAYLSIRDHLIHSQVRRSTLDEEAKRIFNHFKEADDGHEAT